MLPFTPISEQLLSAAWVTEEYPVLAPAAATAAPGWQGFIYMDHAARRHAATLTWNSIVLSVIRHWRRYCPAS